MLDIIGYKGEDSAAAASSVQSPDSLHSIAYYRALDLVSEGEILGLVNGWESIFFNQTRLMNTDGSLNFQGVSIDFRPGTQDQDYISGFPSVENEIAIGVELRSDTPWVYAITNTELSAARLRLSVSQLEQTNTSNGNITGYYIEYVIELSTDNGVYVPAYDDAFNGKTTTQYERSLRVELPPASMGWSLRIRRLTANQNSATIADTVMIEAVTDIIDAKLRYPMSALVGVQVDASQFNSPPARAYDLYGRIIKVPTNYNPATREYIGVWDGTFKLAWSDCPPWIFYDLVLNDRYGGGGRIDATMVDKWSLYQIAQYCDAMVPDGKGGTEPRYTCNLYLQTRADAFKVLQDIASIFRGMAYWGTELGAGTPTVLAVADRPQDPVYCYTPANSVGNFTYQGSGLKTRYTVALVSWSDPSNFGAQAVEYVPDDDGIARYGIQQTEVTAIGCTSQGQAQRVGKWTLLTSRLETESVTFSVGLDGTLAAPGQVFSIADPKKAGRPLGGRVHAVSGRKVTLDRDTPVAVGAVLRVNLPSGAAEAQTVQSVTGRDVVVAADWTIEPSAEAVWTLDSADLKTQLFRCLTVTEGDGLTHDITGLQYEPGKFDNIDFDTRIDPRPTTILPPSVQPPPTGLTWSTYNRIDQGISETVAVLSWNSAASATQYSVDFQKDNGNWVHAGQTGALSFEIEGIFAGSYIGRVRSINAANVVSVAAYSMATELTGNTSPPPAATMLTAASVVFGINLAWGLPDVANTVQRSELWYSQVDDRATATKLTDLAYPQSSYQMQGLSAGASFFFWVRLVDTTGNEGPWFPADAENGVHGVSSADATAILQYLAGEISRTELAGALLAQIDSGAGALVAINQIVTQLDAMYTIKTQLTVGGVPYMAGIGVGVENDSGVVTEQILLDAGRVAILDTTSGNVTTPFVVQGGQTFINQALIGDAWITNGMIGNVIQSTATGANGQPRWKLDKSGTLTINGAWGSSGGYLTLNDSTLLVYDGNGTLRVRTGIW
jgi:predicted phage tail protein